MTIRNVVMIGIGAVGSVYSKLLQRNPKINLQCVMDPERKRRYENEGIYVNNERVPLAYKTVEELVQPVDLFIFCVKNPQMEAALDLIESLVNEQSLFLSLLNGIDSENMIAGRFGRENVLYGLANGIDATKEGQKIEYTHPGILYFGEKRNDKLSSRVETLKAMFDKAEIPNAIPEDMERQLWHKFMVNTGINPVTAIMRATHGMLRDSEELMGLTKSAMREVVQIAKAKEISLTARDIDDFFEEVWTKVGYDGKSSMLQDIEAGRKTENDFFAKRVMELGKEYSIDTPINESLYAMVKYLEKQ
ncbi:ketopantoate reductase family protein [Salicibibacter cibi]|uniref:2-dehydropantoate 2-reductase n=1 Tax=Salicibibacter cibi TaxID=2743001 RepID=A0A7T7CFI0_9BACI|nr:ketopantoate reductase family protein [Salicibibacter cibi]QQK80009.1 ketopantoate reductase family protein [Salicibibacter cibi]